MSYESQSVKSEQLLIKEKFDSIEMRLERISAVLHILQNYDLSRPLTTAERKKISADLDAVEEEFTAP